MKEAATKAALLWFAIKLGYFAVSLPKLDVMAVDKLLRGLNHCTVIQSSWIALTKWPSLPMTYAR
jgi:hypothetical protein